MLSKRTRKASRLIVAFCAVLIVQFALLRIPLGYSCGTTTNTLTVDADVGSVHFRGETAEFYVLVSYQGRPVNADISPMLYYGGGLLANLTDNVEYVDTGLYRVPFEISLEASPGTYALVVNATTCVSQGTALKSFLLSPTLTNWNGWIIDIQGDVATISTDVSMIKVSLQDIDARLVSIDGRIATIETDVGVIKADIENLNAVLLSINGTVATINTNVGKIIVDLGEIKATLIALNETVATIKTDLGDIETSIEDIRLQIATISGNVTTISTTLGDINGTLVSIEGDIANIKTDLGDVKVSLPPSQWTTYGIPAALAVGAVAAIGSSISAAMLLRKRPKS
jgi:archaellum component FlaC